MGQLRSGILELQKSCVNMEPQIAELETQQDDLSEQVFAAAKRIEEGLNTLVLYLMEKFKKEGKSFDTEGAKALKDVMDSNVMAFGKGIVQAKGDVKAMIMRLNTQHKATVTKLMTTLTASTKAMTALKSVADKKKAKLLKSAKYKTKIGGYLQALQAIDDILKKQTETIKGLANLNQNDTWVERNYKFSQDMTVKQVKGLTSAGLDTNIKDYMANKTEIDNRRRVFRDEYKSLGLQFATMKKWAEDADGMEAEA